ncbi:GrlR family regulatory protein [Sphingomonas taxi]|uniref:GrlR family regulatory protein n=1 Tax=Sphingomonas taxi TaxID=1549858 RepID=UPI000692249B|nr:GrlR family regulatory protein [Sphingomonas taxi]
MADQLLNGLYKLGLETRSGAEHGVAYLHDGRLRGGDSGIAYLGIYRQDEQEFSADLSLIQHRHVPGAVHAFRLNDVRVELNGVVDDANMVKVQGAILKQLVLFTIRLSQMAD